MAEASRNSVSGRPASISRAIFSLSTTRPARREAVRIRSGALPCQVAGSAMPMPTLQARQVRQVMLADGRPVLLTCSGPLASQVCAQQRHPLLPGARVRHHADQPRLRVGALQRGRVGGIRRDANFQVRQGLLVA